MVKFLWNFEVLKVNSAGAEQICAESWLRVFVEHADVFTLRLKVLTSLEE